MQKRITGVESGTRAGGAACWPPVLMLIVRFSRRPLAAFLMWVRVMNTAVNTNTGCTIAVCVCSCSYTLSVSSCLKPFLRPRSYDRRPRFITKILQTLPINHRKVVDRCKYPVTRVPRDSYGIPSHVTKKREATAYT